MSKSLGNAIEPREVIDRFGADALRWYFFTSKQPWDGYRFSLERSARRSASSCCSCGTPTASTCCTPTPTGSTRARDRRRSRPSSIAGCSRACRPRSRWSATGMDDFDATGAGRAIEAFVDELSNWYVRRSRRRFWDGDPAAFATLRTCLITIAKLLAPFCPFVADEIYDNLDGDRAERPPVRLPGAGRGWARRRARGRDGHRPRDGPPRARRPRPGEAQGAPAAARSGRRRHRRPSARRSSGWPTSSATS